MRYAIYALIFHFGVVTGWSQHKEIDSLQRNLAANISERQRADILLSLSNITLENDPIASLEHAQHALQLGTDLESDSLIAYANLYQGNAFLHSGSYGQALEFYVNVIPGAIDRNDSLLVGIAYANMGNVYYFQGDYENALKNDLLSLEYFSDGTSDRNSLVRKANLLSNIGSIYDETRQFEKAAQYYDQAYDLALTLDNHELLGNVLNNRGTLYRDQEMDDLALKYYKEALQLRESRGNKFGMARSNFSLGLYCFNHKRYDLAIDYLSNSVELGKQVGSLQTVRSSAEYLYQSLRATGDHENALKSLELFMQVKDSLYNEQTTRKIAQLEMQFEFDKKQKEIEAIQNQKDLYYLLAATVLIFLLLVATILFLVQRNKVRKAQIKTVQMQLEQANLKNDIEIKDKELASNVVFLLEKNELINNISEKLLTIKKEIPQQSQGAMQRVIMDLQSNIQPELWQEFEFRFQQVHENFYRALSERFPT